jgi:hypothetical protein
MDVAPIRRHAGQSFETGWQVYTASGRAFSATNEMVWMFDNEIDWVIQGRAHCKAAVMRLEQVFKVRRVSLGVVTRERVSVASYSQGEVT